MHLALRINQVGLGAVVVDGHDIGKAVAEVTIKAGYGRLTEVTMQLSGVLDLTAPARIELPAETVDALKILGWTPPPGTDTGATTAVQGVPR